MLREFITRVGTFLILIGLGVLILFVASDQAGAANFDYLFWALMAIILGFFLRRKPRPQERPERFSILRRLRGSKEHRKERP